jgi:hypothetical protein
MRMVVLPGLRNRRRVDQWLTAFFRRHEPRDFRRAVGSFTRFYALPPPRVSWFEYLDWGKTAGRTYENGNIQLVHPENWKRGRKYNSERQWVHTVYHELGHYLLWADAERKADHFAYRFVRGISADRGGQRHGHRDVLLSRARRKRSIRARRARPTRAARGRLARPAARGR